MKKKTFSLSILLALLSTAPVLATNPFSDVASDHWAFQSVAALAEANIIKGYPDSTFKGTQNITRYELAQMVGQAIANQKNTTAEQQAIINKLSNEFSSELKALGIRLDNLNEKIGNVKTSGDIRLRYRGSEEKGVFKTNSKSKFDYRARIQFDTNIAKNTSAIIRIRTGNTKGDPEFGNTLNNDIAFDRLAINHKFNTANTISLGRTGLRLGEGLAYSNEPFDGIIFSTKFNTTQLELGYGALTSFYASTFPASKNSKRTKIVPNLSTDENPTLTVIQIRQTFSKNIAVAGYYLVGNQNIDTDFYGVSADIKVAPMLGLSGEWIKAKDFSNATAWVTGISYGNYTLSKANSWDLKLQYFDEDINSPVFTSRFAQAWLYDYKGWLATVDYALDKNLGLSAFYGFGSKNQNGQSLGNYYRAEFNLKF